MHTTNPASPPEPLLLTVTEAAALLGLGRTTLYELILRGDLMAVKIGRARRVPVASIQRFVASLSEAQ